MRLLPVAIIAVACYTAGMIHGEWRIVDKLIEFQKIGEKYERTLD